MSPPDTERVGPDRQRVLEAEVLVLRSMLRQRDVVNRALWDVLQECVAENRALTARYLEGSH